ncbi:hypothetical protein DQ04_11821010 [Trypanosoma grayi]|uniref:hypothetical protein n=1 Tax=Trypanosoma grayi TaxID=71804 RepID=UPI0004F41B00|nr:hypothetical protein DQ04_11821010 [Trypanosoma grayi]KEG06876.1 hypothetical protein DQ04_11821010 [Trypanosoma grayi]
MDTFRIGGGSPYSGGGLDQLQQPPQQSQQQQQGLLPSTSMAAATAVAATPARVAGGNVAAHTTVHVTATAEVDPFDEKRLEEIRKTLLMLEDIAQGRHIINWKELVDPSQPMESAKKISAALARPTTLPEPADGVSEEDKCGAGEADDAACRSQRRCGVHHDTGAPVDRGVSGASVLGQGAGRGAARSAQHPHNRP